MGTVMLEYLGQTKLNGFIDKKPQGQACYWMLKPSTKA